MGSMSIVHWGTVLLVIILVFGTGKLANIGTDLGKAVKGFKDNLKSGEARSGAAPNASAQVADKSVIDVEIKETARNRV